MNALIKGLLPTGKVDLDERTRWKVLDDVNFEHPRARLLGDLYKEKIRVRQLFNPASGLYFQVTGTCTKTIKAGYIIIGVRSSGWLFKGL